VIADTGAVRHRKSAGFRYASTVASIQIAVGILRSADHEKEIRTAAAALPDDWKVELKSNPGIGFNVRVAGPGLALSKAFARDNTSEAAAYLTALSRQLQQL
jgi:hypothetical protein